ncbi:Dbl homology domain-containing protein [Gorgonomyces haynaldii]|nr:Dbl homology domain-containing protein [Gorgonomyces haynaldii]
MDSKLSSEETLQERPKRELIIEEIIETEKRYVDSLDSILQCYLKPLKQMIGTEREIVSKRQVNDLFANIANILVINRELLKQLQATLFDSIGQIFINLVPFLKIYSTYAQNFNNALNLVHHLLETNPSFKEFVLKQQSMPSMGQQTLQSLLLMPVQRIPRYKLLLEDLLKHTASGHQDYTNIFKAFKMVSSVADFVNETIRQHETALEMINIQKSILGLPNDLLAPGRTFIKRGKVQKISRKSHQPRILFLFSDILVYCSPGILETQFMYHRTITLDKIRVQDVPDVEQVKNIFQILQSEKSFAMYCETPQEKQEWLLALQNAIQDVRQSKSTLKNDPHRPTHLTAQDFDAPVWIPDALADHCMLCSKEFTILFRRHHCRACGKIVCHDCSKSSFYLTREEGEIKARACDTCIAQISREGKFRVEQEERDPLPHQTPLSGYPFRSPNRQSRVARRTSVMSSVYSLADSISSLQFQSDGQCSLCLQKYGLTLWKHQCHKCGRSMCGQCTPSMGECDPCFKGQLFHFRYRS